MPRGNSEWQGITTASTAPPDERTDEEIQEAVAESLARLRRMAGLPPLPLTPRNSDAAL